MKLSDQQLKVALWALSIVCITVLIALGKLPTDALKYVLLYAGGALGGSIVKLPGDQSKDGQNE